MSGSTGTKARAGGLWAGGILLLAIVAVGFWLRWLYVRDVSLFVDEYISIGAGQKILSQGLPLLPSGNFYSHGLLLSYIEAAVLALGGRDAWLLRLPVLIVSTLTLVLTFWFGRRAFSPAAGIVATALLAFAPEAILWGGRVRMYAPLQFFVLLATIVFYLWVVLEQDRPLYPVLFVLFYWGALFSHAEAMLLLPIWGLWALGQRGWRWCLRPASLAALGLAGLSVVIEILLRRLGPPVQARLAAGIFEPTSRQYLDAALDSLGVQRMLESLFLTPVRVPVALLLLGGLGYLLLKWVRKDLPGTSTGRRSLAYLYALVLPVLAVLLFGLSPSWRSPRYAFMLLPQLFLIAAAVLAWLGRWLQVRVGQRWAWVGLLAVVALIATGSWPSALAATQESVPAYDWAFGYVEENQQPGDVVVTFLCPGAFFHLGRCDYLAIPTDFAGFAYNRDGRWFSGWGAVPMLDSADGLSSAIATAPRAWFVVDEGRFHRRYDVEFQQMVWDELELVAAEGEMLVFRSRSDDAAAAGEFAVQRADIEDGFSLSGHALKTGELLPGHSLPFALRWQAQAPVGGNYTVFVHLVDDQGRLRSQVDAPPLRGLYPTTHWQPGHVLTDHHTLPIPADLEPGRYRLQVGLYDALSRERLSLVAGDPVLDYLWIGERPPPASPRYTTDALFGDALRLVGYDLEPAPATPLIPGADLALTLYWQVSGDLDRDYTVFVHLLDEDGQIGGQSDGPPLDGAYPTSHWDLGEQLVDVHTLHISDAVDSGEYRLVVGLYTLDDGQRLPVTGGPATGADNVELAPLTIR